MPLTNPPFSTRRDLRREPLQPRTRSGHIPSIILLHSIYSHLCPCAEPAAVQLPPPGLIRAVFVFIVEPPPSRSCPDKLHPYQGEGPFRETPNPPRSERSSAASLRAARRGAAGRGHAAPLARLAQRLRLRRGLGAPHQS